MTTESNMSNGTLLAQDSRTGMRYEIPIRRNTVRAVDLQQIRAPSIGSSPADQVSHSLRVDDPGLRNTAVTDSAISFSFVSRNISGTPSSRFQGPRGRDSAISRL